MIQKNIDTWKHLNPHWSVNLLTKDTIPLYISEHELPKTFYDNTETTQVNSDIVRTLLLYKYGGVWIDASIILIKPLDWIENISKKKQVTYIGYFMPSFTNNYPVIESWFMATTPQNYFIKLILHELQLAYGNRNIYVNGKDTQKIPKGLINYLWIHIAIIKVLKDSKFKDYYLIDAYKDAFKLHREFDWNSTKLVDFLISEDSYDFTGMNLIKLRGDERNKLSEKTINYSEKTHLNKFINIV
jgi:hypothetical protein